MASGDATLVAQRSIDIPAFEECLSRCRVFADFQQVYTKIVEGCGEFKRAL